MQEKQSIKNKSKIVILDCNAVIHRAYHALPPLTTRKGDMVNAVYGFFTMFFKAVRELKPDYIVAAFDLGGETFRHKEFEAYKAHREAADQELYQQIPIVQDILKTFNVPIFAMRGVEADDIIGAISKNIKIECIIITGDMDMLQLVDENISVYAMRKGLSDMVLYDKNKVFERFGFGPEYIVDYKGLKGDPSDNIPGVSGVGDKTATDLIQKFGAIEEIYNKIESGKIEIKDSLKKKLLDNKDQAVQSKRLATILRDIKIDFKLENAKFEKFSTEEAKGKFKELGMNSLVKKLEELENKNYGLINNTQKSLFDNFKSKKSEKTNDTNIKIKIDEYYKDGIFSKEIRDLEIAVIPVIKEMEKNGIKADVSILTNLSKEFSKKISKITKEAYNFAGIEFNLSSPQQLSEILFEKLHLPADNIKKTPGGVLSTSASELEKLYDKSPIIPLLLKYRELEKLRNTYIDALPKLIDPKDGRIHTKFDQLGTTTGRISSSNPNLQNIPIRSNEGGEIRKAFVAEKGFKFVSFDYSQIDLRVIAHLSEDKKMVEAFQCGKDIHKITAAEVFGVKESEVSDDMRRMAKTVNFGIIYGMSAFGMSERSGVSREDAKKFIDKYFKNFSGAADYIEKTKKEAKERGYVETLFGRKRYIKELQSKNWQLRAAGERMAINMPIQGTSADIVKMAMRDVYQDTRYKIQDTKMILQVHDDLLFEIKENLVDDARKWIKDIMENVAKLKVPLIVDVKIGDNWGEMYKF